MAVAVKNSKKDSWIKDFLEYITPYFLAKQCRNKIQFE